MDTILAIAFFICLGFVAATALWLSLTRPSYRRLGVRGIWEYAALLVQELLPEQKSEFSRLEPRIARRLTEERLVLSSGATLSMGSIEISVAAADFASLASVPMDILTESFEELYVAYARRNEWRLPANDRVVISITTDVNLKPGAFTIIGIPAIPSRSKESDAETSATRHDSFANKTTVPLEKCHIMVTTKDVSNSFSELDSPVRIGRSRSNAITLPYPGVSRHHLSLRHSDSGWTIVPGEQITNPLTVDGTPLTKPQFVDRAMTVGLGKSATISITPDCSRCEGWAQGE